ncbi:MAG: hypothetical protein P1V20_08330 [Verrucomicrobiales bacterium]|nr:hypothetical protein [Verrucomicrobiales bacterium]
MKKYLTLIFLWLNSAAAGDVQFEFHVYRMEAAIGMALEERLITGGEAAIGAYDKLPDFVRQRRITELDTLSLTAPPGDRVRKASKETHINLPAHEAVDGLEIEMTLESEDGSIDFTYYAAYTNEEKDQPIERTVTSQMQGKSGVPMLLCRWQMERDWLLLIGKATGPDIAKPASPKGHILYIESGFYPSATSAKSGRDMLASTRIPCLSGKQGRAEMTAWIDDDNILDTDQPGFRVFLDPDLYEDGTVRLTAKCGYIVQAGGRTRLENGERTRRLKIREVSDTFDMQEGVLAGRKSKIAALEDIDTKEDNYVAAFKFVRAKAE